MRQLRKYHDAMQCPKCGGGPLEPQWSGIEEICCGEPNEYIETGFAVLCPRCEYREEVLPLDRQGGQA